MDNHPALLTHEEAFAAADDLPAYSTWGQDVERVRRAALTKALQWAAEVATAIVDEPTEQRVGIDVRRVVRERLLNKLSPCNYVSVSSRTCEHGTNGCTVKHGGWHDPVPSKGAPKPDRYIDVTRAELHADPQGVLGQPPGTWVRVRNPDGSVSSVMGTPHAAASDDGHDEAERQHWTRGYAAAMGAIWRCFHQGDVIQQTMVSDGITIEQMETDGAQEFDLRSIREALGRKE